MNSKDSDNRLLRQSGERGLHNKIDWLREADGKITSAEILREAAMVKNDQLTSHKIKLKEKRQSYNSQTLNEYLPFIESANKSSFLLLGYALELVLKAGIVSLLINAPKHLVETTVRNRYGHKLFAMANDLKIELSREEKALLNLLQSYIVQETRYPISSSSVSDYCEKMNYVALTTAKDSNFALCHKLYFRIREKIKKIDGSEDDPKIHFSVDMGDDGYLTYREGGGLPPVIVIKYSSTQVKQNQDNLISLKDLLLENNKSDGEILSNRVEYNWESAIFFEVDKKKGLTKLDHS